MNRLFRALLCLSLWALTHPAIALKIEDLSLVQSKCPQDIKPIVKLLEFEVDPRRAPQPLDGFIQFVDLDGDGKCEIAVIDRRGGSSISGWPVQFYRRDGPRYDFSSTGLSSIDIVPIKSGNGKLGRNFYYGTESDPYPLPGQKELIWSIVQVVQDRTGGPPYVGIPVYSTRLKGQFQKFERDPNGERTPVAVAWEVFRWNPKTKQFKLVDGNEFWTVRAFISRLYLNDALQYLRNRQYADADLAFDQAGEANPRDPNIFYWWGMTEFVAANFKEAVEYFELALDHRYPQLPPLYFNLGISYEALCWSEQHGKADRTKRCKEDYFAPMKEAYDNYLKAAPNGERADEVRKRLANIAQGNYREPSVDQQMAKEAAYLSSFADALSLVIHHQGNKAEDSAAEDKPQDKAEQSSQQKQQNKQQAKPATKRVSPEAAGQAANGRQVDTMTLKAQDLKPIDAEIHSLLSAKNLTFNQDRIDWMVAYKAKFPDADINDMISRPQVYEALPWVKQWREIDAQLKR